MKQKLVFAKAKGRKKKRHASSIELKLFINHEMHLAVGDTLTLYTGTTLNEEGYLKIILLINEKIDIFMGDWIKIDTELSPAIGNITIERPELK